MVIGIRGRSGVGKSTLASILCYVLNNTNNPNFFDYLVFKRELDAGFVKGKWQVANFASTLKIAMATMYGIDFKQYEDGDFKDQKIGQRLYTLNVVLTPTHGEDSLLIPIASRTDKDEIENLRDSYMENILNGVEFFISSRELTWRDTLNEASHGLHLYLGPNIALQAYQHRFNNPVESLIMADVRKPKEIDLIYENGGVIIDLHRNFIYGCSYKEAEAFFNKKGYFYNIADGSLPIKETEYYMLKELEEYQIPVAIDCEPKYNLADDWLKGDDRADFILHNPISNPHERSALQTFFDIVVEVYPIILEKLVKNG